MSASFVDVPFSQTLGSLPSSSPVAYRDHVVMKFYASTKVASLGTPPPPCSQMGNALAPSLQLHSGSRFLRSPNRERCGSANRAGGPDVLHAAEQHRKTHVGKRPNSFALAREQEDAVRSEPPCLGATLNCPIAERNHMLLAGLRFSSEWLKVFRQRLVRQVSRREPRLSASLSE